MQPASPSPNWIKTLCGPPENMHVGIRATKGTAEAIFSVCAVMLCLALAVEHSLSPE